MSRRRLLVIDAYDAGILEAVIADEGNWDVLLLGLSEAWFRWVAPELPPAGPRLRFLDPAVFAADAQSQVRDFVSATARALPDVLLGGRRLKDILTTDLRTSWWYLETSERGPYRTPLVFQLYQLALIDRAIVVAQYDDVMLASRQQWLREIAQVGRTDSRSLRVTSLGAAVEPHGSLLLRYWRHALAAVAATLMIRFTAFIAAWPSPAPAAGAPCVFSFYPAWWTGAGERASERFFSSPPPQTCFLCWFHAPRRIWESRRALARLIADRRIVVLQRLVSWARVAQLLSPGRFAAAMGLARRLRRMTSLSFACFDVTPLVVADLERSLTGGDACQNPLIEDAVANAARGPAGMRVVYRAEFQPAERALVTGLGGGSARTIGFVHYLFGPNYLSAWDNERGHQPLPDAMLTCGDAGRVHLEESGFPASRIALCGPQRHAALIDRLKAPRDRAALRRRFGVDDRTPLFLVTPAIVEADTEALLAAVMTAVDGIKPCRLVVRTHPNRATGDAALHRVIEASATRMELLSHDVPLYDAIEASDAIITIGSTVAFEAMALACMPIVFENPSTYAATSLAEFADALYVVRDGGTLRSALREVLTGAPGALGRRERWADTVARTLGDTATEAAQQLTDGLAQLEQRIA